MRVLFFRNLMTLLLSGLIQQCRVMMLRLQSVSRHAPVDSEPALSEKQLWRFLGKGGGKETARRAHRGDCHIPALA